MEDDPAKKIPLLFFFFPDLIAPSNLLDLVYPVVEETAVSEQLEESQGKNLQER